MLSKASSGNGVTGGASAVRPFNWRQYIVYIAFVGVLIYFSATLSDDGFLSTNNMLNIIYFRNGYLLLGLVVNNCQISQNLSNRS